jgi:hypothetical protein
MNCLIHPALIHQSVELMLLCSVLTFELIVSIAVDTIRMKSTQK